MIHFRAATGLLVLLRHKPWLLPSLGWKLVKGAYRRKTGYFGELHKDQRILEFIKKMNKTSLPLKPLDDIDWSEEFEFEESLRKAWVSERGDFLRANLRKLSALSSLPESVQDREDSWSAVQLNWLFYMVRSNQISLADSESAILAALSILENNKSHWIYRAFTLSEFVTNVLKIRLFQGAKFQLDDQLYEPLQKQLRFILENAEIYKNSYKSSLNHTNNHVLANVRAFLGLKFFRLGRLD